MRQARFYGDVGSTPYWGGGTIGGLGDEHIPSAADRAILQGWPAGDPMVFPPGNTETENRVLAADLVPPPFAGALVSGDVFRALVKAGKVWRLKTQVAMLQSASPGLWSDEDLCAKVMLIEDGTERAAEVVHQIEQALGTEGQARKQNAGPELPIREVDCGEHGTWCYWGADLRFAPRWQTKEALERVFAEQPWNLVRTPPLISDGPGYDAVA